MSIETWIAFVLAATIILVIPGPTIILVVSQAITHGRRSVIPLATGVLLGDFTAMAFSLLGLGAILSASAALFVSLKWIGAIYLIYLGVKLWRSHSADTSVAYSEKGNSARSLFKNAFIVTALNPKSIAFFVAFLPQFVTPQESTVTQLFILGATFLFLCTINAALYAIFAGQLSDTLKKNTVHKWLNRCGGSALIGAGLFTAAMQRDL
jgi:threonine/homoserine/homoserine lactone efflux protein